MAALGLATAPSFQAAAMDEDSDGIWQTPQGEWMELRIRGDEGR